MIPRPNPTDALLSRRRLLLGAGAAALLAGCTSTTSSSATTPTTSAPGPSATTTPAPATTSAAPTTTVAPTRADAATVLARSHVPILCYHQIRDRTGDDSASARAYIIPPATFTAQLDTLRDNGFTTVTPDQLMANLSFGTALPAKPVMLTYDDSDLDGFTVGAPAMAERGFTGTYFAMTVVLGKKHYMSSDQLRQLEAAGNTVGAHTWDHHRVDRYAGDDWRVQLDEPGAELAEVLGHPVSYFAYPYGAWNPVALPHVLEAGYTAAFQLDGKPLDPEHPELTVQRAIANPSWSSEDLLTAVTTAF